MPASTRCCRSREDMAACESAAVMSGTWQNWISRGAGQAPARGLASQSRRCSTLLTQISHAFRCGPSPDSRRQGVPVTNEARHPRHTRWAQPFMQLLTNARRSSSLRPWPRPCLRQSLWCAATSGNFWAKQDCTDRSKSRPCNLCAEAASRHARRASLIAAGLGIFIGLAAAGGGGCMAPPGVGCIAPVGEPGAGAPGGGSDCGAPGGACIVWA
jgi:hypothetical protein